MQWKNKWWLTFVNYRCSDDGCSGSRELVSNQMFDKLMGNIVDKWSVWLVQWLYVVQNNENSQTLETIFEKNKETLPSLLR